MSRVSNGRRGGLEALTAPLLLVGVLLSGALLLAPEHPQDQAAICQRHNGPVACRVW